MLMHPNPDPQAKQLVCDNIYIQFPCYRRQTLTTENTNKNYLCLQF